MKKARAWLDAHHVDYVFHDYKVAGITKDKLELWVNAVGWEPVLNRGGTTFRTLAEAEKQAITAAKAIKLMLANPSMIKRPVVEANGQLLVGFKSGQYEATFKR
jgi:arsenate reductase (glutaredoxin)